MLKLALLAAGTIAVGTTAVVVHQSITTHDDPPPATATAPVRRAAPAQAPKLAETAPAVRPQPRVAPAPLRAEAPSDEPKAAVVDRATIDRLRLEQGPTRGPANAPVTVVLFTDMKCPFCVRLKGTLDQLEAEMPDKMKLVVKQFPVHETAKLAAEATFAADAQGKFWELFDQMYEHQDDLSEDAILGYAKQAGLDVASLRDALDRHTYASALATDQATGKELDITATPSYLINGKMYRGALPIETLREAIKSALR
jgi:protein-disulfide isomerase